MKFQFGYDVLTLPGAILSHTDANAVQLRVILWLASDLTLARKPRQLAKLADCDPQSALDAMAFWAERGVLTEGEAIPAMATATGDAVSVDSPKKAVKQAVEAKATAESSAPAVESSGVMTLEELKAKNALEEVLKQHTSMSYITSYKDESDTMTAYFDANKEDRDQCRIEEPHEE